MFDIIIIIVFGLLFTLTLGAVVAMVVTDGMKEGIIKQIVGILIACAIGFGIIGLLVLGYKQDVKVWNNGVCLKCNTEFELFDIERNLYYYQCENGHLIKTSSHFNK